LDATGGEFSWPLCPSIFTLIDEARDDGQFEQDHAEQICENLMSGLFLFTVRSIS
jgi:hypothetical protein